MNSALSIIVLWRMAFRELRTGVTGFRVFLVCIILGVAAVATVGSLSAAVTAGLQRDAKKILGGDLEISVPQEPISNAQYAILEAYGRVSHVIEMRAMSMKGEEAALAEIKAVDRLYPLFGAAELEPMMSLEQAFSENGIAVERALLNRLGAHTGDSIRIGDADYVIRAILSKEPDNVVSAFSFGPRILMTTESLKKSALLQPGSLVRHRYRIALKAGMDAGAAKKQLLGRFMKAGWRIKTYNQATDSTERMLDNFSLFLTLIALTTLLCSGIGISNGIRAYLSKKDQTIATLKTLGAGQNMIFGIYLMQVTIMVLVGIAAGLLLGAALPVLGLQWIGERLPVATEAGIYPAPLMLAALFGLLVTYIFSLLHIGTAMRIPPALLFRARSSTGEINVPRWVYALCAGVTVFFAILVVGTSQNPMLSTYFVTGALASFALFYVCSRMLQRWAATLNPQSALMRQGIACLYRPAAATTTILLSLGVGLSVLVIVALVERALHAQLIAASPRDAPSFFFLDIQPDQLHPFIKLLKNTGHARDIEHTPMLRGTITKINGIPAVEAKIASHAQWAVRRERGFTFAAVPPANARLYRGKWWLPDYRGPPLISFDSSLADGMDLSIGDTVTFTIAGEEIEATIKNLRDVDYGTLEINFATVFSPGAIEQFPHTFLATAKADTPEAEAYIIRSLAKAMPNISTIHIRQVMESMSEVFSHVALAARITAGVTLLAALLVLMGAVSVTEERRAYDTAVLKVLGARRQDILSIYLVEFLLLAVVTICLSVMIGTVGAYAIISLFSFVRFLWAPEVALVTVGVSVSFLLGVWLITAIRAYHAPAMSILRNE